MELYPFNLILPVVQLFREWMIGRHMLLQLFHQVSLGNKTNIQFRTFIVSTLISVKEKAPILYKHDRTKGLFCSSSNS